MVGKVGTLTAAEARKAARDDLAAVAGGADPSKDRKAARGAQTVGELCDQYLEAARAGLVLTRFGKPKRASTVSIDEGRVSRHIKPLIGREIAAKLNRAAVQRMCDAIAAGKTAGQFKGKPRGKAVVTGGTGTAARVVELLGGIWTWAEKRGFVKGANPAHGVDTARGEPKDRTLTPAELVKLGKILRRDVQKEPAAAAAVRLVALTGLRRSEAVGLKWGEVDFAGSCLRLQVTKTGRSVRPIGKLAVERLALAPKTIDVDAWLFPSAGKAGRAADLAKPIAELFDAAGLTDARCHDLRRTFASTGADEGYSDATIGELLGHARRGVTAQHYIRRPDAALVEAAGKIAARIGTCLDREDNSAEIVGHPALGQAGGGAR